MISVEEYDRVIAEYEKAFPQYSRWDYETFERSPNELIETMKKAIKANTPIDPVEWNGYTDEDLEDEDFFI